MQFLSYFQRPKNIDTHESDVVMTNDFVKRVSSPIHAYSPKPNPKREKKTIPHTSYESFGIMKESTEFSELLTEIHLKDESAKPEHIESMPEEEPESIMDSAIKTVVNFIIGKDIVDEIISYENYKKKMTCHEKAELFRNIS